MTETSIINSAVIEQKRSYREQLEADMERFLQRGGKIQAVGAGATGDTANFKDFSINPQRDAERRNELDKQAEKKMKPEPAPQKEDKPKPAISATRDIRTAVKEEFKKKGTTMNKWCIENGICTAYASGALKGSGGKKTQELRQRVLDGLAALPEKSPVNQSPAPAAAHSPATLGLREVLEWWIEKEKTTGRPIYVHHDRLMAALVNRG